MMHGNGMVGIEGVRARRVQGGDIYRGGRSGLAGFRVGIEGGSGLDRVQGGDRGGAVRARRVQGGDRGGVRAGQGSGWG